MQASDLSFTVILFYIQPNLRCRLSTSSLGKIFKTNSLLGIIISWKSKGIKRKPKSNTF